MTDIDYRWEQFPVLEWTDADNTARIVQKIRQHTRCGIEDDEIGMLYELARGLHNKPDTQGFVVELGTCEAGSACALGLGVRDAESAVKPVITVDSYYDWQGHERRTEQYVIARDNLYKFDLAGYDVSQIIADSPGMFFSFWNKPTRVFFIDSSHWEPNVRKEIACMMPLMVEDGWIVFHDYIINDWGVGVIHAINDFLDQNTTWNVSVYRCGGSVVLVHLLNKI